MRYIKVINIYEQLYKKIMIKYFNTLIEIARGYRLYLFIILIMEGVFFLK